MKITHLGFDDQFAASFSEHAELGRVPVRISLQVKNHYLALTEHGEILAEPTGRLRYDALTPTHLPVVGDWAAATILEETPPKAQIHAVVERKNIFCRKEAGKRVSAQPVAANIDTVFIAAALDHDYSMNRIERYLTLVRECRAFPIILLTKSDVCADKKSKLEQIKARIQDVPVMQVSSIDGEGLDGLRECLQPGMTYALLGSSGVGKSTLINRLLGAEVQKTIEVRKADSKGRHATTNRQLFVLPSGAMVIDTPGMRELQLWDAEEGIAETFSDIDELSGVCRFADCRHTDEPGCAVLEAAAKGAVDPSRLENYRKMARELRFLSLRQTEGAARLERTRWKDISKMAKKIKKNRLH